MLVCCANGGDHDGGAVAGGEEGGVEGEVLMVHQEYYIITGCQQQALVCICRWVVAESTKVTPLQYYSSYYDFFGRLHPTLLPRKLHPLHHQIPRFPNPHRQGRGHLPHLLAGRHPLAGAGLHLRNCGLQPVVLGDQERGAEILDGELECGHLWGGGSMDLRGQLQVPILHGINLLVLAGRLRCSTYRGRSCHPLHGQVLPSLRHHHRLGGQLRQLLRIQQNHLPQKCRGIRPNCRGGQRGRRDEGDDQTADGAPEELESAVWLQVNYQIISYVLNQLAHYQNPLIITTILPSTCLTHCSILTAHPTHLTRRIAPSWIRSFRIVTFTIPILNCHSGAQVESF